jgi:hypothetical protein
MGVQRPSDADSEQLRQAPVHAWSQQTPSTQWFFWHSLDAVHGWPSIFGPQVPLTQAMPTSQSALLAQVSVHAPFRQANGWHSCMAGSWQVPRPSQVAFVIWRLPVQLEGLHSTSRAYFEQPPKPSQSPVCPQVVRPASLQIPRGSGLSASTGQHVPSRPVRLQETQGPWHAMAQQTPSAQ